MTDARTIAKERQLDWLLDEVLGSEAAVDPLKRQREVRNTTGRWLVAAFVALGVSVASGVAWLRHDRVDPARTAQEPEIEWTEAHGPAALDAIPIDCTNLRCFDFDDEALQRLPKWTALERLDLSGMDVNDKGYSTSLPITDAGVAHLAKLQNLRWLSLSGCGHVTGATLSVLENVPRLEHLDLSHTAVDSSALERLPRLPVLRELSLTWCMDFHGRSLAEVARIAGLRRLELRGCVTIAAADALHLAKAAGLRYLDLRDCQGSFRGQTLFTGDEPENPPVQDGIGITDAVVAALAELPLETLLLGGSESLTDAIGEPLATMPHLRELDLSNLPKTTGALLREVPRDLTTLGLDHNPQWPLAAFATLPALSELREFGLAGLPQLDDDTLGALLANKNLRTLRLGGAIPRAKLLQQKPEVAMTGAAAVHVGKQRELVELDLRFETWLDRAAIAQLATLPNLRTLDLTGPLVNPLRTAQDLLPELRASRSIEVLRLRWRLVPKEQLALLADLPLRELEVAGTNLTADEVRELAPAWPGCTITMLHGQRFKVP